MRKVVTGRLSMVCAGSTVALLLLMTVFGGSSALAAVPDDVCADCHELAETFEATPHGVYFSGALAEAGAGCASCHGDGVDHAGTGDPADIINPADHDQFGGDIMCLNCHDDHQFDDWQFSAHNAADMNCSDCHTIHGTYEEQLRKPTPELCYECHSDVRASTYMPSRHPIAEGKMECADCHGIHGGPAELTQDASGRELCLSCHAEIEGPFVFEHAPVLEDCSICHVPHGAVANNLLVQNEPALCLSCHAMHFHTTVEGVDGQFDVPQAPERSTVSTRDGFQKAFATKCTQCHSQIHGSDLPSQAASNFGNALTR